MTDENAVVWLLGRHPGWRITYDTRAAKYTASQWRASTGNIELKAGLPGDLDGMIINAENHYHTEPKRQ